MEISHIVGLVSKIRGRAHQLILRELANDGVYDLAPSHGKILDELYRRDGLQMNEIARRVRRDKSTITALVNKLEKRGYVRKTRATADGRATLVSLTPKGQNLRPTFDRVSEILLDRIYRGMPPAQRETLIVGLEQVLQNLLTYFDLPRPTTNQAKGLERRIE